MNDPLKPALGTAFALPVTVGSGLCFGPVFGLTDGNDAWMREAVPAVRDGYGLVGVLSGRDILPGQPLLRLRRSRGQPQGRRQREYWVVGGSSR